MNKEQIQRLHYLCNRLGLTANALITITDFHDNFDNESFETWGKESLVQMKAGIYYHVPKGASEFYKSMTQEEKLTKIVEVLEEAYKTIIEE